MAQAKNKKVEIGDREGQINFRYEKEKKDRLQEKAASEGMSVSQLLASWCDEYIGAKPKSRVDAVDVLMRLEEMTQAVLEKLEKSEGKLAA